MGVSRITVYNYLNALAPDLTRSDHAALRRDRPRRRRHAVAQRGQLPPRRGALRRAARAVRPGRRRRRRRAARPPSGSTCRSSGYGVKAFTLSMVEAAITVSEGTVPAVGDRAARRPRHGHADRGPVRLLPDVPAVLADLGRDHRLVLITKGDLVHQTRKVDDVGHRPPLRAHRDRAGEGRRHVRRASCASSASRPSGSAWSATPCAATSCRCCRSAATPCTSRTRCCGSTSTSTTTRTSTSWRSIGELPAALRAARRPSATAVTELVEAHLGDAVVGLLAQDQRRPLAWSGGCSR